MRDFPFLLVCLTFWTHLIAVSSELGKGKRNLQQQKRGKLVAMRKESHGSERKELDDYRAAVEKKQRKKITSAESSVNMLPSRET